MESDNIRILKFRWESFFRNSKMDKNKCPKMKRVDQVLQIPCLETIIEFYGLVTKKIIFGL